MSLYKVLRGIKALAQIQDRLFILGKMNSILNYSGQDLKIKKQKLYLYGKISHDTTTTTRSNPQARSESR